MMLDTLEERGLAAADIRWGDEEQCRFPLFESLRPLPLHWMVMLYFCMSIGISLSVFLSLCLSFLLSLSLSLCLCLSP